MKPRCFLHVMLFTFLRVANCGELRQEKNLNIADGPPPPPSPDSPNDQKIPSCFRIESSGGLSPELQKTNTIELCHFQAVPGRLYELHLWKVAGIGSIQLSNAVGDVVDYVTFDGTVDNGHVFVRADVDCFERDDENGMRYIVRFSCESLACVYLDHTFTESKERNCEQQMEYIIIAVASGMVLLALSVGTYCFVKDRRVVEFRSSSTSPSAYVSVSQNEEESSSTLTVTADGTAATTSTATAIEKEERDIVTIVTAQVVAGPQQPSGALNQPPLRYKYTTSSSGNSVVANTDKAAAVEFSRGTTSVTFHYPPNGAASSSFYSNSNTDINGV